MLSYQKDKWANPGNLATINNLPKIVRLLSLSVQKVFKKIIRCTATIEVVRIVSSLKIQEPEDDFNGESKHVAQQ
jgi:hypothetical protein